MSRASGKILNRSFKWVYPPSKLLIQELPSGPDNYGNNNPIENRVENDARCDYRNANETRFGQVFIPAYGETIAFETLEAGQVCVVTPNGAVHPKRNPV